MQSRASGCRAFGAVPWAFWNIFASPHAVLRALCGMHATMLCSAASRACAQDDPSCNTQPRRCAGQCAAGPRPGDRCPPAHQPSTTTTTTTTRVSSGSDGKWNCLQGSAFSSRRRRCRTCRCDDEQAVEVATPWPAPKTQTRGLCCYLRHASPWVISNTAAAIVLVASRGWLGTIRPAQSIVQRPPWLIASPTVRNVRHVAPGHMAAMSPPRHDSTRLACGAIHALAQSNSLNISARQQRARTIRVLQRYGSNRP